MKLFVRISHSGKKLTLNGYDENCKISKLKEDIKAAESMPSNSNLMIIHAGQECLDPSSMAQNNLVDSTTVHMILRRNSSYENQGLQCGVCLNNYKSHGSRVPHVLPCGHSLCGACISQLNPRTCPFDRMNLPSNDFPRNFTIISLLDNSQPSITAGSSTTEILSNSVSRPTTEIQGRIQVFVKTLTGLTIAFDVAPYDTVLSLKQKIMERQGVPVSQQRLVFSAKQLADSRTLRDNGISNSSTIHLITRMLGGGGRI